MFAEKYRGRRVLITGHSGFMGSWLTAWLERLGARICGVALRPVFEPNHYRLLAPEIQSEWANLREPDELNSIFDDFRPEIVFHLAAQSLVCAADEDPAQTFSTNVMGTVNLLESCRRCRSVHAVVALTEQCATPSSAPYSASRACGELVADSYARTFFHNPERKQLLALARTGCTVGGGDWAAGRFVPDLVRSAVQGRAATLCRSGAFALLHVLDPLSGCLALGSRLLDGEREFAATWEFAAAEAPVTPETAAEWFRAVWPQVEFGSEPLTATEPEESRPAAVGAPYARLGWRPLWSAETALRRAAAWYRDFHEQNQLNTSADFDAYFQSAEAAGVAWYR